MPHSRPTPLTGNKHTVLGSALLSAPPTTKDKPIPLWNATNAPTPQAPQMDVITLTAAVQTAMQLFMARLEAAEKCSVIAQPADLLAPAGRPQTTVMGDKVGPTT